jgi:hypothetical protein
MVVLSSTRRGKQYVGNTTTVLSRILSIENLINHKLYIGQTEINKHRFLEQSGVQIGVMTE